MIGDWHPNVLEWDTKHDRHSIDFKLMLWEAPFWWCLQWWCFTRLATCSFGNRNEHGEEFGMTIAQCCSLWNMVKLYLVLTATSVFSRTRSFLMQALSHLIWPTGFGHDAWLPHPRLCWISVRKPVLLVSFLNVLSMGCILALSLAELCGGWGSY